MSSSTLDVYPDAVRPAQAIGGGQARHARMEIRRPGPAPDRSFAATLSAALPSPVIGQGMATVEAVRTIPAGLLTAGMLAALGQTIGSAAPDPAPQRRTVTTRGAAEVQQPVRAVADEPSSAA